jgi:glycosyltransferase involved in cell wall biosynthesis
MNKQLRILFTGNYQPDYNRTEIIRKGLLELGHKIEELPFEKKSCSIRKKLKQLKSEVDFIYMPPFTHREVKFVRCAVGDKFILFDPLISRYLTKVYDYKLVHPWSFSALRNFYRDKWSMGAADKVITDTKAHLNYFHQKFSVPLERLGVVYIGNDFSKYSPGVKSGNNSKFKVGFYGGFIPLQGVMNILAAAQILNHQTDIEFELIGNGFEYDKARDFIAKNQLKNIVLPGWVSETELVERIRSFDMALGIFGETEKTDLVIPNKVYHYASCAKAILTKDTPAIRELFTSNKDILFASHQPEDIAKGIVRLKNDLAMTEKLGQSAHQMIHNNFSAKKVAEALLSHVGFLSI